MEYGYISVYLQRFYLINQNYTYVEQVLQVVRECLGTSPVLDVMLIALYYHHALCNIHIYQVYTHTYEPQAEHVETTLVDLL